MNSKSKWSNIHESMVYYTVHGITTQKSQIDLHTPTQRKNYFIFYRGVLKIGKHIKLKTHGCIRVTVRVWNKTMHERS